ncbi:hypothetical protein B296_00011369 [Ensete ventricosum]|uniref:Uncharacterized protein n=1 Tax=Ensete ventricosum TaxID=4639 RepID=A0A427ACB2_ENSVE|nr:hypothetical protein B296_00011369 [Ensete ventricosum]
MMLPESPSNATPTLIDTDHCCPSTIASLVATLIIIPSSPASFAASSTTPLLHYSRAINAALVSSSPPTAITVAATSRRPSLVRVAILPLLADPALSSLVPALSGAINVPSAHLGSCFTAPLPSLFPPVAAILFSNIARKWGSQPWLDNLQGAIDHDLATCKGATGCGQGPPTKGRSTVAKAPCTGCDRLRPARRGGNCPRAQPLVARRPQGAAPATRTATSRGSNVPWQGGYRRARAATTCARAMMTTQ